MNYSCAPEKSETDQHRRNAISSQLFLRRLMQHHMHDLPDYNMKIPAGWVKPEPRIEFVPPPEPTLEYKELWFSVLDDMPVPVPAPYPQITEIQRAVARHCSVRHTDMISERRTHDIVLPRQLAMYLSKKLTLRSLPEIGRKFGGRDHSTVHYAIRKIEAMAITDESMAKNINALTEELCP